MPELIVPQLLMYLLYYKLVLISYKYKLENGEEYRLVCTKLTHIIASYVREHNFKAPESVLKLYNYLANGDAQYRGLASFITWF
ncbi:bacteriocin immunity protein [Clostridium butyricum]|uniref:bacteriocin immunity protein n=1 Tax=Clostridium butyricum TaxID=1492 RepID=UPI0034678E69